MTAETLWPWNAAVFSSRESPAVLGRAIDTLCAAARKPMLVDVLVNGNRSLADNACGFLMRRTGRTEGTRVRVWHLPFGDKANTWNQYAHRIWPGGEVTFFVDGYVFVEPDALLLLDGWLKKHPEALGATGVPQSGRSAAHQREILLSKGGLHGNLFALPAVTLALLRQRGFRLPLALYRTDSTLGAALAVAMEPVEWGWNGKRFLPCNPSVTWLTETQGWWRWRDLRTHWRRKARQAQGDLENRAVAWWIMDIKAPPERMPGTAFDLIEAWASAQPEAFRSFVAASRLRRRAWDQLHWPRDLSKAQAAPELVFDSASQCTGDPDFNASPHEGAESRSVESGVRNRPGPDTTSNQ
jgi:hypothetical protein